MGKFKELLSYIVIIVVVVLFRTFIATPVIVDGDSMLPNLKDNQVMILYKKALLLCKSAFLLFNSYK